ncbi:phage tail tape measure protein [Roseibium limicola]|nr:phage tail tape measure protein [Roseibium limicola]
MPASDDGLDLGVSEPLSELEQFSRQMSEISREAQRFSLNLTGGLKAALVDGKSLQQVFSRLALGASSRALNSALAPLENLAGQAVTGAVQSVGQGLSAGVSGLLGAVTPFARGGVVSEPGLFSFEGGLGMAGEAGAEAILPLARGRDGRLGVRTGGAGLPPVTINVAARDVQSFSRAEAQVSAMVARAVGRGRRGL